VIRAINFSTKSPINFIHYNQIDIKTILTYYQNCNITRSHSITQSSTSPKDHSNYSPGHPRQIVRQLSFPTRCGHVTYSLTCAIKALVFSHPPPFPLYPLNTHPSKKIYNKYHENHIRPFNKTQTTTPT
jgi:hypothetical protein